MPVDRGSAAAQAGWATAVKAARTTAVHTARLAAVRVPAPSSAVPAWVVRGVVLACIAATGATGAVAGLTAPAPDGGAARLALPGDAAVVTAPTPPPAVAPGTVAVPVPDAQGTGATAGAAAPPPSTLDAPAPHPAAVRARSDGRRPTTSTHRDEPAKAEHTDRHTDRHTDADDAEPGDDADARDDTRTGQRGGDEAAADQAVRVGTGDRAGRAGTAAAAAAAACDRGGSSRRPLRAAVEFLGCAVDSPDRLRATERRRAPDRRRGLSLLFPAGR